jgi:hypothetical protein
VSMKLEMRESDSMASGAGALSPGHVSVSRPRFLEWCVVGYAEASGKGTDVW